MQYPKLLNYNTTFLIVNTHYIFVFCLDYVNIDYLSRYEMLLYVDPLAHSMTPWQKNDFEMAFRMVKPTDIFSLVQDTNGESTDYTNSDTD